MKLPAPSASLTYASHPEEEAPVAVVVLAGLVLLGALQRRQFFAYGAAVGKCVAWKVLEDAEFCVSSLDNLTDKV